MTPLEYYEKELIKLRAILREGGFNPEIIIKIEDIEQTLKNFHEGKERSPVDISEHVAAVYLGGHLTP